LGIIPESYPSFKKGYTATGWGKNSCEIGGKSPTKIQTNKPPHAIPIGYIRVPNNR